MGALVAVRHDPEMGAFYRRLLSRGKRNEQALVAVVHKLRFGAPTPNEP
jgi:transposase